MVIRVLLFAGRARGTARAIVCKLLVQARLKRQRARVGSDRPQRISPFILLAALFRILLPALFRSGGCPLAFRWPPPFALLPALLRHHRSPSSSPS